MPYDVSAMSALYKLELWVKINIIRILLVDVEQIIRTFIM